MSNFLQAYNLVVQRSIKRGGLSKAVRDKLKQSASRTGDDYPRYGQTYKHYTTGKLYRSIKARYKGVRSGLANQKTLIIRNEVEYSMADYGIYQDRGYKNVLSRSEWISTLHDWIIRKGIARGKESWEVAYKMASRKQKQPFIPASNWIKRAFEDKDYNEKLANDTVDMVKASEGALRVYSKEIDLILKKYIK